MAIANDIVNRLSDDAMYDSGGFYTAVFSYGAGIIEWLADAGYQPTGPDGKVMIEIEADIDDAEVYIEGQAMPSPIESTILEVAFTPKAFRGVIRESGHERRRRGSADQGARVRDPQRKVKRATARIKYQMAKTFDDAAVYGLQGQVSQTTNFGDQSRSTYTKLKPYKLDASSSNPTSALLNEWFYKGQDDPYGCLPDTCVASATQCHKIAEVGSQLLRFGSASDSMNLVNTGLRVGTAPLYMMPNLETSTIYGLSGMAGSPPKPFERDADETGRTWRLKWHEENPGRFHVLDLGANNADLPMNIQISTECTMYHVNPNEQSLLTGLSTG